MAEVKARSRILPGHPGIEAAGSLSGLIERKILWQAQEGPQKSLIACPVFEVFFGGARGGGKTEASLGDWIEHQAQYGVDAVGIFFRRKLTQLSDVIARSHQLFGRRGLGAKWNEQKKEWIFRSGARLRFAYIERDADAEEYQGHSYTRVYIEEVTNFPSSGPIMKLKATLRSAVGVPCGMRLTGNPGGPGHNWVKARYIIPNKKGFMVIVETEEIEIDGVKMMVSLDRVFIPSRLKDNPLLLRNDPTYIMRLRQSGSEALVKAWLDGNWDAVEGAFFDEFREDLHVLRASEWLGRIPHDAMRFRSFDWGSAKPFSVGWYVLSDGTWGLPNGALLKYREWYGASGINVGLKMLAETVADGIVFREEVGERIDYSVADPSIFIRNGGPSIAETMGVHKVQWRRGDNKRQAGWEEVRSRLGAGFGKAPMLYFLDSCADTIRTLPVMQHDDTNEEDLDTEGEDHAVDELRYACMSRPFNLKLDPNGQDDRLPRNPNEYTILELIEKGQQRTREAANPSSVWN